MSERRNNRPDTQTDVLGLKRCPQCNKLWNINGFNYHYAACQRQSSNRRSATPRREQAANSVSGSALPETLAYENLIQQHANAPLLSEPPVLLTGNIEFAVGDPKSASEPEDTETPTYDKHLKNSGIHEHSFKLVYHSCLHRSYQGTQLMRARPTTKKSFFHGKVALWAPFRTYADFRFARNALSAGLSQPEVNEFLALHQLNDGSAVTLRNYQEIQAIQDRASQIHTEFQEVSIDVPYQIGKQTHHQTFQVWVKSLKDWMLSLVLHPQLQPLLHFDAYQKFCEINGRWMRVIDEPWTADNWLRVQASLPADGLPISIHLYADKALASYFECGSSAKRLYPVVARLCNLPRELRNGTELGGGKVVALLPVVSEASKGLSDARVADFKCLTWHMAIQKLLDTIWMEAQIGYMVELDYHHALGLEKKMWRLFPYISILSADYEEQLIMACLRSVFCLAPCVRCLTPDTELHNLSFVGDHRELSEVLGKLAKVETSSVSKAKEELKSQGYRPVKNAFLTLGSRTNPYAALSYDTLHTDDLGRWGKHLWPLLKSELEGENDATKENFNACINAVPPWPDLTHFESALSVDLSDGTKYLNLMKLCTKKYGKNFAIPKMHYLCHLFDDIQNKGVTANYTTKPGERMHGALREAYVASTRRKSSANAEVLRKNHASVAYDFIQARIDDAASAELKLGDPGSDSEPMQDHVWHIKLMARRNQLTLGLVEEMHQDDPAFGKLDSRVHTFIKSIKPEFQIPSHLPLITYTFKDLKVQYESQEDWCLHCDLLRCTPKAYGKERYDYVLLETDEGVAPAQLLMLFECLSVDKSDSLQMALVLYMDPVYRSIRPMEREMGFRRFRRHQRGEAEVVSVQSIIRGALMVPISPIAKEDPTPNDFFANDLLDVDMYLRFLSYTESNKF